MPKKGQKSVIELLKEGHQGVSRIKAIARSFVWWSSVYGDRSAELSAVSTTAKFTTSYILTLIPGCGQSALGNMSTLIMLDHF